MSICHAKMPDSMATYHGGTQGSLSRQSWKITGRSQIYMHSCSGGQGKVGKEQLVQSWVDRLDVPQTRTETNSGTLLLDGVHKRMEKQTVKAASRSVHVVRI